MIYLLLATHIYFGVSLEFFGKLDYSVGDVFYAHTSFLDYVVLELDFHTKSCRFVQ